MGSNIVSTVPTPHGFARDGANALSPETLVDALVLTPGMSVADFGCGGGHFTLLIARRVGGEGKVYAIDVQATPLEMLQERAKNLGLKNIQTIRANLEVRASTTLQDNSQDLVLLANVLFQSSKKELILQEAHRILKPSGKLALIEWRKGAGGFGPPEDLRLNDGEIATLVQQQDFKPAGDLHLGTYHHVLTFTK